MPGAQMKQAMSMGLPVLTTAWGGSTEFTNTDNSFPLPISGMGEAFKKRGKKSDMLWAEVNITSEEALQCRAWHCLVICG